MIIDEPYNSWLVKNVGDNIDDKTRFLVSVDAMTDKGAIALKVSFDLTWFILLYSKDNEQMKLNVALELLKKPGFLDQFKATLLIHDAKRLLAEFLLFNPMLLEGLKNYIDFSLLNIPLDIISHALLIKLNNETVDSTELCQRRLRVVNAILSTGYKLGGDAPAKSLGVAIHKLLLMNVGAERFELAKRLVQAGYKTFSENVANNCEVAVVLIDNRNDANCLEMIKNNIQNLQQLTFQVAGSTGNNIVDYYYWVKEDMPAVDFIRKTLNMDISP